MTFVWVQGVGGRLSGRKTPGGFLVELSGTEKTAKYLSGERTIFGEYS